MGFRLESQKPSFNIWPFSIIATNLRKNPHFMEKCTNRNLAWISKNEHYHNIFEYIFLLTNVMVCSYQILTENVKYSEHLAPTLTFIDVWS